MEAHPRNLKSIFRSDVRLVVPLFQRPYVWSADAQWAPLWDDVLSAIERVSSGDRTPHFLGAVVLMQRSSALGSLDVREVIDGQQRLTTLQLLIAAVHDTFVAHGLTGRTPHRLRALLRNDPAFVDDADEIHKLWPTNRDRPMYRRVMAGEFRDAAYSPTLERIPATYCWFRRAIEELLATSRATDEPQEVLGSLAEVLLEALEMVVIDLGEHDNAQMIFETLNARGTPLRASDLIKNLVFRTLQDADRSVEKLYETQWAPFESAHWETEVRVGRLLRNRLDTFMGFFLVVWLSREVQAHQLFSATRSWIGTNPDRAEEFLLEASRYASVYEDIEACDLGEAQSSESLRRLKIVDTTTLMPLLLWIGANTSGSDQTAAITALESYVVRRSLCRLTQKNYNRLFLELLKRLVAGESPVGEVVTHYLDGQRSDSGMWPSDTELVQSLEVMPLYKQLRKDSLALVLRSLERHATGSRSEVIASKAKLSIEHLMPQQWNENWPLPQGTEVDEATDTRNSLIHTIGNLTLVTGPLNSGLSNRDWNTKRSEILDNSAFSLNRNLPQVWDENVIRERSRWLAGMAATLWPRPELTPGRDDRAADSDRDLRADREVSSAASESPTRTPGRPRRDIGAHIVNAFANKPPGTFLTINQIRTTSSPEYGDELPSAGAISARLFPSSGATTVPGVTAETRDGRKGARRL